ncbi:MAG TPA: GDP-mannose 4,6-dehydratase, partial [Syntrophales bacterium]|nr:GDP-mannose 4,6-dehydratase [Syntrophales bacterium]
DHLYRDFHDPEARVYLHYGDLSVSGQLMDLLGDIRPDEIYHLGAQSHVRVSFDMPEYTGDVTGLGTLRLLEAIRKTGIPARFYQASSSEMFGAAPPPQSEATPFHPQSPYAAAKVYAYYIVRNYREAYGLFATNGILFNHESPRRGETFVTRKITRAATRIKLGLQNKLYLGNLQAKRDWGFAGDYVEAMWLMLQQETPDDFAIATGEMHSVQEFVDRVFAKLDLDPGRHVAIDPRYFRPTEVDALKGDASRARTILGWTPRVDFDGLVEMMVAADMELAMREKTLVEAGYACNGSSRMI